MTHIGRGLHRQVILILLGAVAFSATAAGPAQADGGFVVSSWEASTVQEAVADGLVSSSGQRAVLWKMTTGGWQLIIDPGTVTAADAAWILPLPEVPAVSEASPDFVDQLDAATFPLLFTETIEDQPWQPGDGLALGCAGAADDDGSYASDGAPEDVTVWGTGRLGLMSYDVVSSEDPQALQGWLDEHGYLVPDDLEASITPYVDDGFFFFVARFERQPEDSGQVPMVRFTLSDTDTPSYPLRLSRWSVDTHLKFTLWFILPREDGFGFVDQAFVGMAPADCPMEQLGWFWSHDTYALHEFSDLYAMRLYQIFTANGGRSLAVQYADYLDDADRASSRLGWLEDTGVDVPMLDDQGTWSPELQRIFEEEALVMRLTGEFPREIMDEDLVFAVGELDFYLDDGEYDRTVRVDVGRECAVGGGGVDGRSPSVPYVGGMGSVLLGLVGLVVARRWSR